MEKGQGQDDPKTNMKKVGNFLINLDRQLGEGQYGKVFLAQEIESVVTRSSSLLKQSEILTGQVSVLDLKPDGEKTYFAVKIVNRKGLSAHQEALVVSEINNQEAVKSRNIVSIKKAIKTEARFYIFMEFCNGMDLKIVMEQKGFRV